ncbi:MAG: ABC transporter ATP-binding protein [Bacteroidales bacterium]
MPENGIYINQVSKSYGNVSALNEVSFTVKDAELFGLIGPDGAGKTSLLRILTSLLKPDSGKATMAGFDVVKDYKEIRKIVGYMPGKFSLYFDLTVEENLNFFATIFGTTIEENYDLIKDIYHQIKPFKNRKAGKLSGGMKQKLALSCALIHKPKILILDEPTTGVDAVSRKEFWEMLKKLKEQNITILVSTPYMDEAGLCDRVALIQKGKIMQLDTPAGIVKEYSKPMFGIKSENMYQLLNDLIKFSSVVSAHRFGDSIHVSLNSNDKLDEVYKYLEKRNHTELHILPINPTIEDCFMALMTDEHAE